MVDKVRILGKEFKVVQMTSKEITNVVNSFERLSGYIIPNELTIYIATDMEEQVQFSSMLHESLHALFPEASESSIEEGERRLFAFIRDNPELIKGMIK